MQDMRLMKHSSRLPAYRATHLVRYHPYPRICRRLDIQLQPRCRVWEGLQNIALAAPCDGHALLGHVGYDGASSEQERDVLHAVLDSSGLPFCDNCNSSFVTLVIDLALLIRYPHRQECKVEGTS
ncbi:hypothetical protein BDY19DRAFT_267342 [Irpex rosettiformis]|uniref:Uncharacterized protein n=1 Tax=Irpex rosettiformis TaxID=378272 RepID=A0ACB8UHG0_9APHY|nr:hypothetical protein BDY19DRAFT_267342 [Irpex rosettiformis]